MSASPALSDPRDAVYADLAARPRSYLWADRKPDSPGMAAIFAKVESGGRSARANGAKSIAREYLRTPRELDRVVPGLSSRTPDDALAYLAAHVPPARMAIVDPLRLNHRAAQIAFRYRRRDAARGGRA